jgi:large subunit ribosomal protein L36e
MIFVPTREGATYWAIQFLIYTNLVFYTIVTFIFVFQCSPREKTWNAGVPGQCLNVNSVFFFSGAWNILSDISMLVLPIHSIFKLHLPTRRKIQVSAVFAVGLL